MKALFITEKYHSMDHRELGFSNSKHNIIGSWQVAGLGPHEQVFMSSDQGDIWSSEAIISTLTKTDFDFALLSGNYGIYPDKTPLKKLLNAGKKIGIIWWDTIRQTDWEMCQSFADIGMPQLILDNNIKHPNCYCLETPQDTRIYYRDDSVPKDIDVSFVGALNHDRAEAVAEIQKQLGKGRHFIFNGGRGHNQGNIPLEDYASLHRRSKICLNFSANTTTGRSVVQRKGRPYEVAASGGFLLSNMPEALKGWFVEDEEYIVFTNIQDLILKIKQYLADEGARKRISENAYKRFNKDYAPIHFWNKVMNALKIQDKLNILHGEEQHYMTVISQGCPISDGKNGMLFRQNNKWMYLQQYDDVSLAIKAFLRGKNEA